VHCVFSLLVQIQSLHFVHSNNLPLVSCEQGTKTPQQKKSMVQTSVDLLPEDIIDNVLLYFLCPKSLFSLQYTNSKWKSSVKGYILKKCAKFQFRTKFGSYGTEYNQMQGPNFVTTDEKGNIFVSDCWNNKIKMFDSHGEWKQSIQNYRSRFSQFQYPMGIAFNSKGNLIVADKEHCRIQIFSKNVAMFGSGLFNYLSGIAVDSNDNIIALDYYAHCIQVIDCNGVWKQTIKNDGCADSEFDHPWGVSVSKLNGRVFVSDSFNHRIQVFNSELKFLFNFGSYGSADGQFRYPQGLMVSNCGQYLFVCDSENHRIQIFNAFNGEFIKSYGSLGSGDGQFDYPCGICVSNSGKLIISETGNHRVQIFE